MLIDKSKYKDSLSDLWHGVFGDSYDFIELIFKPEYDNAILCFAELDGDRAVSAFYLIKNTLKYENEFFDGYYLYAAATLPEHRKSGHMSRLIREAQDYCLDKKIDFISLVPSEESLYGYYARFGFESGMYRWENKGNASQAALNNYGIIEDTEKLLKIRNGYEGNIISFHPSSFGYAIDCLDYSGFTFKEISEDCYLLYSDGDEFSEFLSSKTNLNENAEKLRKIASETTSPCKLEFYDTHNLKPYGMLYPINRKLKRQWNFTDIYMNIALD